MKNREEVLSTLTLLKSELIVRFHVRRIGLFGSVARGEDTRQSDIDLLVEFDRPVSIVTLLRLESLLSERLGRHVDLVTPDTLKPIISQDIISEAIYV
jgi:predicted nucleotidyltransferase